MVLGRHNDTKKEFAIKIIEKAKVCDTEERKKRVLAEIGILRQCNHRSILKLHEVYETALDISLILDLYVKPHSVSQNSSFLQRASARSLNRNYVLRFASMPSWFSFVLTLFPLSHTLSDPPLSLTSPEWREASYSI